MINYKPPTVSIITPYLNAETFVDDFVSSIRSQHYPHWICILVDDGSTDHSSVKLQLLTSEDDRFLLTSNPFHSLVRGPANARNHGLKLATTELVAFCDIDDLWHPQKLSRQVQFHMSNQLDISVTAYYRFLQDHDSQFLLSPVCPPKRLPANLCYRPNPVPMLTVICRRTLLKYEFQPINHEDFLFWIENLRSARNLRYGCLPEGLAFYRCHQNNLSSNRLVLPIWTYNVFRRSGLSRTKSLVSLILWLTGHIILFFRHLFIKKQRLASVNLFNDIYNLKSRDKNSALNS